MRAISSLTVVVIAAAVWGFLPGRQRSVTAANGAATPAPAVVAAPAPAPANAASPAPAGPDCRRVRFTTPEELDQLSLAVIDAGDTIEPAKRAAAFRATGLDTQEHLESAIAMVREEVPHPPTAKAARERVLALHYLKQSSRLDPETCASLLKVSIARFEGAGEPGRAMPHLWDLHDIALICTKLDPRGMTELQKAVTHPKVSAQLRLVLKTEGVL